MLEVQFVAVAAGGMPSGIIAACFLVELDSLNDQTTRPIPCGNAEMETGGRACKTLR